MSIASNCQEGRINVPKKGETLVSITVSHKERDQVNELAESRGFRFTSDYLRHLIESDAKAHGKSIRFKVDRGGYRGRDTGDES